MLKEKYEQAMREYRGVLEYPWHSAEFYAAWCAQTYYYTSHNTRILLLASAHTPMKMPALHRRFAAHSGEEKGHEVLAERDAKSLGFDVQKIGEFPVTRSFYATQYYTIAHIGVEALFGFILALEGLANEHGREWIKKIKQNSNFPTSFLDVHADEDPDHVEKAFDQIKDFDPSTAQDILVNLDFTVKTYYKILDACRDYANSLKQRKAS